MDTRDRLLIFAIFIITILLLDNQFLKHHKWSQEHVAELMHMSKSSYSRLEREESKLDIGKLEKLAEIFQVDIGDLIKSNDSKGLICLIAENNSSNYYNSPESLINEIKCLKNNLSHLQEIISHKDQIIEEQRKQIALLERLIK